MATRWPRDSERSLRVCPFSFGLGMKDTPAMASRSWLAQGALSPFLKSLQVTGSASGAKPKALRHEAVEQGSGHLSGPQEGKHVSGECYRQIRMDEMPSALVEA